MQNLIKINDPERDALAHVPGPPEMTLGNQFQSVCRCGFKAKTGNNPSDAYRNCAAHADRENDPGAPPATSYSAAGTERPARAPSAPRTPREPRTGRACTCGCGGTTGGGFFLPGHDARMVSQLFAQIKEKSLSVPDAFAKLREFPKLHAKLAKRCQTV